MRSGIIVCSLVFFFLYGNCAFGFDGIDFLEKFGYLDDLGPKATGHSEHSARNAIVEFQEFNGLRASGIMDKKTIRKMQQPRCGLPDVIKPKYRSMNLRKSKQPKRSGRERPLNYYAPGQKWQQRNLKYKFTTYTNQLGGRQQLESISNAFAKWAGVVPLNFQITDSDPADIEISFARRQHNDGPGNAFDGKGGTLAHAFFPGDSPIAGDTHFDEDEQWTVGEQRGSNLEIVAAHEFGHALGLGHSNNPIALMAPFYQGYDENYSLHPDDINGIRSLYGKGRGSVNGENTVSTSRRTPDLETPTGKYCGLKISAIAEAQDGYTYLFRRDRVYQINSRGIVRAHSVKTLFPQAPPNPGAAVYDFTSKKFFIFKGKRYWRYSNLRQLDSGYPRKLLTTFHRPQAAFQWSNGGIFLFLKNNTYVRWWENMSERSHQAPPRPIVDYFRGAPRKIDAALRNKDGIYYFFNGQRYWKFNAWAQVQRGYPKSTKAAWLSCGPFQPR